MGVETSGPSVSGRSVVFDGVLFDHDPAHCRMLTVLHLEPALRPPSLIRPVAALRHQSLKAHLAGRTKQVGTDLDRKRPARASNTSKNRLRRATGQPAQAADRRKKNRCDPIPRFRNLICEHRHQDRKRCHPARKCYTQTDPINDHAETAHHFAFALNPCL